MPVVVSAAGAVGIEMDRGDSGCVRAADVGAEHVADMHDSIAIDPSTPERNSEDLRVGLGGPDDTGVDYVGDGNPGAGAGLADARVA